MSPNQAWSPYPHGRVVEPAPLPAAEPDLFTTWPDKASGAQLDALASLVDDRRYEPAHEVTQAHFKWPDPWASPLPSWSSLGSGAV